jgi:hypothetical protein
VVELTVSAADAASYQRNGYLVVRGLLPAADIDTICRHADAHAADCVPCLASRGSRPVLHVCRLTSRHLRALDTAYTARHAARNAEVEADFAANGPRIMAAVGLHGRIVALHHRRIHFIPDSVR